MKTQEEILERYNSAESEDMWGTQRLDLISLMTYENAKPHLTPDYIKSIEDGTCPEYEKWTTLDVKAQIIDYLPFAYEKARTGRGLSAERSMHHYRTWIWAEDDDFYYEILPFIDDYDDYGIKALDMIAKHYGYKEKSDGTETVEFEEIPKEMPDPASNQEGS